MRKNKFLLLQSFLAIGFLGVSVEDGFAAVAPATTTSNSQMDELAARARLRQTNSIAAQEIQKSAAAVPMMRGTPPPPPSGSMVMRKAPMAPGSVGAAPMNRGAPPPPPPMPMKKGFGSAPVDTLARMGGSPSMNMRAQMEGRAAPISGLRPTDAKAALQSAAPMKRGTPPPPPPMPTKKGVTSAPVDTLSRMGGSPSMNMRAKMEGLAAPITGVRPTDAKAALQSAVPMKRGLAPLPSQMSMNKALGSPPIGSLAKMGGLPPMNTKTTVDELAAVKARLNPTNSKAAQEIAAAKAAAQSSAAMKRGLPPLPPQMSGKALPKMNVGNQIDEINAVKAGLSPTPMRIGTPPPPPGRVVMGASGKLVRVEEPEEEAAADRELAAATEAEAAASQELAAKKKGFFGSVASAMQKGAQKAAATVKKQFTGKCIPGHIPESEEERIACKSNASQLFRVVKRNVAPSKAPEGETEEQKEVRHANETFAQKAARQMGEQAMMGIGQVATAGTAALTARTQQGIDKATGAMTKQIARIAPKPKLAPVVESPVITEEELVIEEPVVQEEETFAPEVQEGIDEYGMATGIEGVDPSADTPDQGMAEQEETEFVENIDLGGPESDSYASLTDPSQEEYQGNPYDMAGEVSAH